LIVFSYERLSSICSQHPCAVQKLYAVENSKTTEPSFCTSVSDTMERNFQRLCGTSTIYKWSQVHYVNEWVVLWVYHSPCTWNSFYSRSEKFVVIGSWWPVERKYSPVQYNIYIHYFNACRNQDKFEDTKGVIRLYNE
jgi:hypothetical protein